MPSRDFTSEDLFSSRMISMQSSTHSSQMKTVGPAISLRTSCWLLPQNEQYSVFLESLAPTLLIHFSVRRSIGNLGPIFRNYPHRVPKKSKDLKWSKIRTKKTLFSSSCQNRSQFESRKSIT